jgi:hypothetical protein
MACVMSPVPLQAGMAFVDRGRQRTWQRLRALARPILPLPPVDGEPASSPPALAEPQVVTRGGFLVGGVLGTPWLISRFGAEQGRVLARSSWIGLHPWTRALASTCGSP